MQKGVSGEFFFFILIKGVQLWDYASDQEVDMVVVGLDVVLSGIDLRQY